MLAGRVVAEPRRGGKDRKHLLQRLAGTVNVAFQVQPSRLRLEGVLQGVASPGGQQVGECLGPMFAEEIGRVHALGQGEDSQVDVLGQKQREHLVRPALPGFVAVEHEYDPIDEPLQEPHVPVAERGAQHGHRILEALLMGDDAVGIPFHHRGGAALAKSRPGHVEPIEMVALDEQRRLGGVDVLRPAGGARFGQDAAPQSDGPILRVADGKQQSAPETVVQAPVLRAGQYADRLQHPCSGRRTPSATEEPIGLVRREAQMELLEALGRDFTVLEIPAGRLGLRRAEEAFVVLGLGPGHGPVQRPLVLAAHLGGRRRGLGFPRFPAGFRRATRSGRSPRLQLDSRPIGQDGQGLGEADPLHLHHEAEDVAADVAHPALERLSLGVDLEAGPRVVVPGTEAQIEASPAL